MQLKKVLSIVVIATIAFGLTNKATAGDRGEKPNIIFYMVDDLGWVDISAGQPNDGNASKYFQTPQIQRLAEEGLSFTCAYAAQNCAPTRAAFQTGQYAPRNGVHNVNSLNRAGQNKPLIGPADANSVRPSAITIAETLRNAGYVTAHFGKFHSTESADAITTEHGYDFNYGGCPAGAPSSGYFASKDKNGAWQFAGRVGPGLDRFAKPYSQVYVDKNIKHYANGTPVRAMDAMVGTRKHLTDDTTDAALEFMETHRKQGKPFFMNLTHYAVHAPLVSRPDLLAKHTERQSTDPRHDNAKYAGLIEGMDQSLGRIIDYLNDPDGDGDPVDSIAGATLVIFYSDNGGPGHTNNSPLKGIKGMHSEGGIRVPMIAWQPGVIAPNTTNNSIVSVTDFYATFSELANAKLPDASVHPLDSISLADVIQGKAQHGLRKANCLHFPGYMDTRAEPTSLIIKDIGPVRYKLLYYYADPDGDYLTYDGGHYELYSLTNDLSETTDLLADNPDSRKKAVAAELSKDLRAWLDETGAVYPTIRDPQTGEDTGHRIWPPKPLRYAVSTEGRSEL
jgi:arylsulfatase A-like enzyme